MRYFTLILLLILTGLRVLFAQDAAEGVPAPTNVTNARYPRILTDNKVIFQVNAPQADKMQIDLGKIYDMVKDEKGVWRVTTDPQVPGFHYLKSFWAKS